jgi:hypothetical protein
MPHTSKDTALLRKAIRLSVMEWIACRVHQGHDAKFATVQAACLLTKEALDAMKAAGTMELYMSAVGPMFAEHSEVFIATIEASVSPSDRPSELGPRLGDGEETRQ